MSHRWTGWPSTGRSTAPRHDSVGRRRLWDTVPAMDTGSDGLEILLPSRDPALTEVAQEIRRLSPDGSEWAGVVRHTFDMIYNGQETGRYRWDQLMKTEKTHVGTLFEINAQRVFGFPDGDSTDFRIAGHQVDAKWSQSDGGWMLPPEVFGELALLATGDDARSVWSLGLIRVTPEVRRERVNRDRKSQLTREGRDRITWLWRDAPLRPNVLLQLPEDAVARVFAPTSGARRTDQLFREAEGLIVHRNAVAAVSRQLDHQKRVRYNGGSRSALRPEGYLILSGVYHRALARGLSLPVPLRDEYVSVRVVPCEPGEGVLLEGEWWRRARPDERVARPAPMLPDSRRAIT